MKNFAIRMFSVIAVILMAYYGLYLGNSIVENFLLFYVAVCFSTGLLMIAAAVGMEAARQKPTFKDLEKAYTAYWLAWSIVPFGLLLGFVAQGWWFCVFFYGLSLFSSVVFQIAVKMAIDKNNDPEQQKLDEEKASRERFVKDVTNIIMGSVKGPQ